MKIHITTSGSIFNYAISMQMTCYAVYYSYIYPSMTLMCSPFYIIHGRDPS
jgi:hypothetical protein